MLNKESNLMYSFVQIEPLSPIPFLQFHHVLSTLFKSIGDKSVITVCRVHTALLSLLHHFGGLSLRINGDLYSVHANLFIVSCSRRSDSRPTVFLLSNMITILQCYHGMARKRATTTSYRLCLSFLFRHKSRTRGCCKNFVPTVVILVNFVSVRMAR